MFGDNAKKEIKRMDKSHKAILITLCVVFMIYSLTLLLPFVWMFINSMKSFDEFINLTSPFEFPERFSFINYVEVFGEFKVFTMLGNSLILCFSIPTVTVLASSFIAYALCKFRFRINVVVYFIAISSMVIPISGTLASTYGLMSSLKLNDTFLGVIFMSSSGMGFNFLIMNSAFKNISGAYSEAAEIDGAGQWRIFFQIIYPQVMPIASTIWILGFIGVWSNYETPYFFLESHETISIGVKRISDMIDGRGGGGRYTGDYPKLFSAILITTLPMVLLYLGFQEKIMNFAIGGGIKG